VTVRFVEDDALIRMTTTEMLESHGHVVIEAASAAQALAALAAGPVDILLTDVGLPDRSGGDLAVDACRLQPALKVIFATGYADAPDLPGATILRKPYAEAGLIKALTSAIAGVAAPGVGPAGPTPGPARG
jgi:CheY-like chemotaxis protein